MVIFKKKSHKKEIAALLLAAALLAAAAFAAGSVGDGASDEAAENLETALRRAVARCYACEGAYPPSLDYIAEHYGVRPDESTYIVHYEYIAANLLPQITVIPAEPGR